MPKKLYLAPLEVGSAACGTLPAQLRGISLVCGFCDPSVQEAAEQLWSDMGLAGPPYFLKIRGRGALQEVGSGSTTESSNATDKFMSEVSATAVKCFVLGCLQFLQSNVCYIWAIEVLATHGIAPLAAAL